MSVMAMLCQLAACYDRSKSSKRIFQPSSKSAEAARVARDAQYETGTSLVCKFEATFFVNAPNVLFQNLQR